ncbi:host cell factor C1 regulator 1 [Dermochelys coriacea]|uniref:host cell factor C1 regulator 1 n=1 Tax=Dermochelys coriacea TaxID=27794 RepID=UPI0018E8242D|nr:host cell factor C1 regulator 1 [Dermochelys coriacea]XP_043373036.1 host cell factor C1 regulator 1 [Dermochelys coriacea]XP_043373037.1 host cell factor C1 regulator 1 [Dermochelys coriacea]
MGWSRRPWLGSPRCTVPTPAWRQEVPRRMPWAARDQGLVSFTGAVLPCTHQLPHVASLALKRRLEKEEQQPSPKQFLSEEKMAARFNTLSLENDHVYSGNGFPARGPAPDPAWVQDYARCWQPEQRLPPTGGSEDAGRWETEGGSVVLEGEFSMADCTPLCLAEPGLLQYLNPTTELVLWTPPGSQVPHSIRTLMLPPSTLAALPLLPPGPGEGARLEEMEL